MSAGRDGDDFLAFAGFVLAAFALFALSDAEDRLDILQSHLEEHCCGVKDESPVPHAVAPGGLTEDASE